MTKQSTSREELVLIWGDLTNALGSVLEPKVFDAIARLTMWISKTAAEDDRLARAERVIEAAPRKVVAVSDLRVIQHYLSGLEGLALTHDWLNPTQEQINAGKRLFADLPSSDEGVLPGPGGDGGKT